MTDTVSKENDEMFRTAVMFVWREKKVSTSLIQRKLAIGYNSAARIIERMEGLGIVSKPDHVGKREVRTPEQLQAAMHLKDALIDAVGENEVAAVMAAIIEATREADKTPPTPTPAQARTGHNSDAVYAVAADELRQFIEQFEHLDAEKNDIAEQQTNIMSEAKARGYDTKALRKIIALRKRDKNDLAEEEAILETYKAALGMV